MSNTLRPDVSEWVLHFIHDRNPENELCAEDLFGQDAAGLSIPAHVDSQINARFQSFYEMEREYAEIEADASAISVLRKIINQGFLASGWSFRGGKATIYGPKSAVCFTEMPLSSLVSYAHTRRNNTAVTAYAVGLLKTEFFSAGGRPVIYGLSSKPQKITTEHWPRFLSPECEIGEGEQYRYVTLGLDGTRRVDWTHEREWRWADHYNKVSIPGLPIWRGEEPISFTRAIIIVGTSAEGRDILSDLRRLRDAGYDRYDNQYNGVLLENTAVVSIEELEASNLLVSGSSLSLEQIPHAFLRQIPINGATDHQKQAARIIIHEALGAAEIAAVEWRKGGDRGGCGFAELVIEDGIADFTRAALELGLLEPLSGVHPFGPGGYWLKGISGVCEMQGIGEPIAAAEAAKSIIEKHLPELPMHIWTRDD